MTDAFNDDLSADMTDPEFAAEFERTNRLIQDLRSDLQESADALEESAQLLEDTLNENARLRAELAESRRVSDEWAKAHGARSAETSIARDESARLRAELAESRRKECDALCSDVERDRDEYEATISHVRAVLDEWYGTSDASALSAEIRTALSGESS